MLKKCTYLITVLVLSSLGTRSVAQTIELPISKTLDGSIGQFRRDSFTTVEDDKWWVPAEKAKLDLSGAYSIKNIVTLRLNEDVDYFPKSGFTANVQVRIVYTNSAGTKDSTLQTLTVNYDTTPGTTYNSKRTFVFYNAYRVTARIISIDSVFTPAASPVWEISNLLKLDNEMQITREYLFSCTPANPLTISANTATVATKGELNVTWPKVTGSTEYDLEWTFIDSAALSDPLLYQTGGVPDPVKIFNGNSSRVTITSEQYFIPLLYDNAGTIFFRYRPVQNKPNGQRYEANWSSDNTVGLGSYVFNGHEQSLNWQATTSFAEEGKRKSVVQYYDGSLRTRQTVTKDNTTDTTIIAETFYDFQGRPAIQVMPVPSLFSIIKYAKNFNVGLNGAEYEKNLYDTIISPTDFCNQPAPGMGTQSGASQYYSANNPLVNTGFHKYIPDAENYPFTETRYAQDGKIQSQSGVGVTFKLGSGHETKYYYGNPNQKELDALFGTEVGDASHYFKNMVRDANGQYSVSYVDMHGRTIATALAGAAPAGMDALASNTTSTITEKLADANNNIRDGFSMVSSRSILVPMQGNYVFNYSLNPDSLRIQNCNNTNICYDCLYNLEITVTDDCNNCRLPGQQSYVVVDSNFTFASLDTLCNQSLAFNKSFTLTNLPEGNYTVNKRLSISQYGYQKYRDSIYLRNNTCKTFQDFYSEQVNVIKNQLDCSNLTCNTCQTTLATIDSYRANFATTNNIAFADTAKYRNEINQAYAALKEQCDYICNATGNHTTIRNFMLEDMTPPTGQYADPDSASGPRGAYNIFQLSGSVYAYQNPAIVYLNESGAQDFVYNDAGVLVTPNQLPKDEFILKFKPSWAVSLLPYHPEYAKLVEYDTYANSHIWDERFLETETYADANSKGYLNPPATSSTTNYVAPTHFTIVSANVDPLQALLPSTYTTLRNKIYVYKSANGDDYSMWGIASIAAKCDVSTGSCQTTYKNLTLNNCLNPAQFCTGELDMGWRAFRGIYYNEKKRTLFNQLEANHPTHNLVPQYRVEHFAVTTAELLAYETFANSSSLSAITADGNTKTQQSYQDNCESYASIWWEKLAPCNLTTTDSLRLIPRMVAICVAGSDADHPWGSSSAKPGTVLPYTSFEALIKHYIDSISVVTGVPYGAGCNAYLINYPTAYEHPVALSDIPVWTKPDSCQCTRITQLYSDYTSNSASYSSFSDYMLLKYNTNISQGALDTLRNLCNNTYGCKFLTEPITLPASMQCGTNNVNVCATCSDVSIAYTSFKVTFPNILPVYNTNGDSSQQVKNAVFVNYMNAKLGFNKTTQEYLSFMDTCHIRYNISLVDTLTSLLSRFKNFYYDRVDTVQIDSVHFRENRDEVLNKDYNKIFANGVAHIPDSLYSDPSPWMTLDKRDTLCIPNDFSIEVRLKYPLIDSLNSDVLPDFKTNLGTVHTSFVQFRPQYSGADSSASAYYCGLVLYSPTGAELFRSGGQKQMVRNFPDWRIIKLQALNNIYRLFIDDTLVYQVPYTGTITNYYGIRCGFKGRNGYVDWIRVYDAGGVLQYSEEFEDCKQSPSNYPTAFTCPRTDCQQQFVTYFNGQRATNYSFNNIDSIYNQCGIALNICSDTTAIACNQLKQLQQEFWRTNIKPDSGFVDLDMRTFAGNKTPVEGPKGVFDINGNLIGNTISGTITQINQSFVQIWNSNTANKSIGMLSYLPNGKFRLTLNSGQQAPCNGIIGMRYYQVDFRSDTLNAVGVGDGFYVDFGDGTKTAIPIKKGWVNTNTYIDFAGADYFINKYNPENKPVRQAWAEHYYTDTLLKTVTIYHCDENAWAGFDSWNGPNGIQRPGYYKLKYLSNFRGYLPQNLYNLKINSTKDTTMNSFVQIANFNDIKTIMTVRFDNGQFQFPLSAFDYNKLSSLERNNNLRQITYVQGDYYARPVQPAPFQKLYPKLPVNFPDLSYLYIDEYKNQTDADSIDFKLPNLAYLYYRSVGLTSYHLDTILKQVAFTTLRDSGNMVLYTHLGQGRTSASDNAINTLIGKNWKITINGTIINNITYNSSINTNTRIDSIPYTNAFTEFMNARLGAKFTYHQLQDFIQRKCGASINECQSQQELTLCGKTDPLFPEIIVTDIAPCSDSTSMAFVKATELYRNYQDSLKNAFDSAYFAKCFKAFTTESFTVSHPVSEYHYTLYYYDQAGNLTRTIPPEGVNAIYRQTFLDSVTLFRTNGTFLAPVHGLPTDYRYNTLNQVVAQKTPDAGISTFWYDRLGRLAVSQNAQQKLNTRYSYTKYDGIGRITQVGQKPQSTAMTDVISKDDIQLNNWINSNAATTQKLEQVTNTVYDKAYTALQVAGGLYQINLRNRVSYSQYFELYNPQDVNFYQYHNNATFYSYDIHGNVDTLLQDYGNPANTAAAGYTIDNVMNKNNNRFKRMVYRYDLISGKVNHVAYQPGQVDAFYHRYNYDAENRLINVETSADSTVWERDARYEYYKHGPLARTLIGQQKVQGLDYAYTVQGWLKGMNSTSLQTNYDMGGDGTTGTSSKYIARDALGFNLNYFAGDYKPINATVNPFPGSSAYLGTAYRPLYNGNISSMAVNNSQLTGGPQLYNYKYDQLNRIVSADTWRGLDQANNNWSSLAISPDYQERYSYDANGNIKTLTRNGALFNGTAKPMDNLTYNYNTDASGKLINNKLRNVNDVVNAADFTTDIDNQITDNYLYDAIGNLIKDSAEKITSIKWNVYGKILEILKTGQPTLQPIKINYTYDAAGNRISKRVELQGNGGIGNYTWYVRDASGNLMATYTYTGTDLAANTLTEDEGYMYGSSRVGSFKLNRNAEITTQPGGTSGTLNLSLGTWTMWPFTRNNKQYEITNHLGNVLVVIGDRKTPVSSNGTTVDYYNVYAKSAQDYYAFGMKMPVRTYGASTNYRYGFNGKEEDDEAKGDGNQQDYGMRIYDDRLGRFLSIDPVTMSYPMLTPYQFASNRPIDGIDFDGLEFFKSNKFFMSAYKLSLFKTDKKYTENDLEVRNNEVHKIALEFQAREKAKQNAENTDDDSKPEVQTFKGSRDNKKGNWANKVATKNANTAMAPDVASGIIALYQWGDDTYFNIKNKEAIEYARQSIIALDQAERLTTKASANAGFPKEISTNIAFLTDVTNYLTDYTVPSGFGVNKAYIELVETWGKLLWNNRESILKGTYDFTASDQKIIKETIVTLDSWARVPGNYRLRIEKINPPSDLIQAKKITAKFIADKKETRPLPPFVTSNPN